MYCEKFDAYYDEEKDEWTSKKCCTVEPATQQDKMMTCWYNCWDRPDKPSMVRREE